MKVNLRGVLSTCSKKDLNACTPILHKKLNQVGLEKTIEYFENLKKNLIYIPYKKHVKGLSHHSKLGPSRRPVKCYSYVIEILKGMRNELRKIEKLSIDHVLINTSGKGPKGARKCSRGRRYIQDSYKHQIVLVYDNTSKTSR